MIGALAVGGLAIAAYLATRSDAPRARPAAPGATPRPDGSAPEPATASTPTLDDAAPPSAEHGDRQTSTGLSRRFDDLFRAHGRGIPVAYLRALAHAESGMRPDDPLGLINVVTVARVDYNRRHPSAPVTGADLRRPEQSVRVAADILRAIINSYARNHPDVVNLREDWSNPAFVALLTFGWNAGYSERGGVGRVVRYLRRHHPDAPITIDSVAAAATAAGAASTLSNPRKLTYCKGVVASYLRERDR